MKTLRIENETHRSILNESFNCDYKDKSFYSDENINSKSKSDNIASKELFLKSFISIRKDFINTSIEEVLEKVENYENCFDDTKKYNINSSEIENKKESRVSYEISKDNSRKNLFDLKCYKLEKELKESYYEDGYYSEAEKLFFEYYKENKYDSINMLVKIHADNVENYNVSEGILRIIENIDYKDLYPSGQVLLDSIFLMMKDDILIQSLYIECFEKWKNNDGIRFLKRISCSDRINEEYRKKVIEYLNCI